MIVIDAVSIIKFILVISIVYWVLFIVWKVVQGSSILVGTLFDSFIKRVFGSSISEIAASRAKAKEIKYNEKIQKFLREHPHATDKEFQRYEKFLEKDKRQKQFALRVFWIAVFPIMLFLLIDYLKS